MGWLKGVKKKLRMAKIKKENAAFAERFGDEQKQKLVPSMFVGTGRDKVVKREIIGTHTGKVIGYETDSGTIHAGCDYHDKRTGMSILSPASEEFEAMQAFDYPRYCP